MRITVLLASAALAACGSSAAPELSAIVRTGSVRGLLSARPFTVAQPYAHAWRREKPAVSGGWLLVLDVDPAMTEPHQAAMPVLLVGNETAECVNSGQPSGHVVVVVPTPELDLARAPAWFGPPELPERVDSSWIATARAHAPAQDLVTFTAAEIAAARRRGGAPLQAASRIDLDREAARLILEHSPEERELAEGLLVPVTK
jgi:hypothetical protein